MALRPAVDAALPQTRRHLLRRDGQFDVRRARPAPGPGARPHRAAAARARRRRPAGRAATPPGAAAPYRAYLALDDRAPRVLYKLGLALYRSGDAAGAADAARRALATGRAARRGASTARRDGDRRGPARRRGAGRSTRAIELQPAVGATRSALADLYEARAARATRLTQREARGGARHRPARGAGVAGAARMRGTGVPTRPWPTLSRAGERFPGSEVVANASGRLWLDRAEATGDPHAIEHARSTRSRRPPPARPRRARRSRSTAARCSSTAILTAGRARPAARHDAVSRSRRDAFLRLSQAAARLGRRDAARS